MSKDGDPEMKRILIIDDEYQLPALIKELLGTEHYSFDVARNGADGVAQAKIDHPDLILTDILLPRMTGYEVIRELRADPRTAAIPIIVLSAKVYTPDRRKAIELGADEFLEKPFNIDELTAAIEKLLAVAA